MKRILWFIIGISLILFCGCSNPINDATNAVDAMSNPTCTVTSVPTVTVTPVPIITTTPTSTPTSTPTPTPTSIPTSTPTPSPTPSPTPDIEPPVIELLGESTMSVIARSKFMEPGYFAEDNCDGELTGQVQITGEVDVNWCGAYTLLYEVTDQAGNCSSIERVVEVVQPEEVIPEEKVIYLTFDDGPGKYTNDLLDILAKYDIKATFFTCGNGRMDLVEKAYEAGHTIAIHCRNHDYDVVYASEEAYFEDLFAMQNMIYEAIGIRPTMIRFPGGSSNSVSSFNPGIMTRLTEQVEQMGFQYFDWNVSSGDSGTQDTERILANLINGVKNKKYAVVLQHPETRKFSMEAVEDFIIWGLENGYTFLPLDETSPRAHHSVNN